jgi:hypothetical protein
MPLFAMSYPTTLLRPRTTLSAAALAAFVALGALGALGATACSKTPEPEPSSPSPGPTQREAAQSGTGAAAPAKPKAPSGPTEIAWDAPAAWQKVENPNPMRKATYKIPRATGDAEDAEMSVSQAGGSVEMNVKRWSGQFETKDPNATKRSERKNGDLNVAVVEIKGTFTGSGMPGGPPGAPKPNYALLGAIVETAGTSWFFKLTGPEKTVDAAKADFDRMVETIRPK